MKPDSQTHEEGVGRLPDRAYLANPFVPFQMENPPRYDSRKGLVRGTLFPGLDLPLLGMVNEQLQPKSQLSELQAMAFVIQELALYLDTHRDDTEALELYREYQRLYRSAAQEYAATCGPLDNLTPGEGAYRWLDDPWPWEYSANQEG